MKESRIQNISLFLLSIGLIAFELYVLRVFSVGNWSNFGSMVISIALLGFGFAGTLLTFLQKKVRSNPHGWLRWSAIGLVPAMALSFILAQQVPFNPVLIVSESVQFFWIGMYYLLYSIPFFFGAMFIGVAFTVISDRIHKLYFWNMAGSGLGGVILLLLMYVMPVKYLIYPVIFMTMTGVVLVLFETNSEGKISFDKKRGAWALGLFMASLLALGLFGDIKVSRFKSTELAKVTFSDLKEMHSEYSPFGEMVVYHSSQFHFAPGLSDNAIFHIKEMPRDAYWGLYIDGNGPINIMRELKGDETTYIDYLPLSAAYQIVDKPEVLLLRLGGGFGAFTALYHDAKHVTVIEPNTALVNMMENVPEINKFNNNLLKNPRLDVVVNEPRAFCETTSKKYDLVEISLIDSVGLSQSVGNPLDENYIYTVEAFKDYMSSLTPDGLLSVTVWNHLAPPRNVPRLLATVATSLKNQGIAEPSRHIYVFHLIYSTATILVKNSPFTEEEISKLNEFCYKMSFDVVYHHGIEAPDVDFQGQLKAYWDKYSAPTEMEYGEIEEPAAVEGDPGDLYYYTLDWIFNGKDNDLYDGYLFDIKPATDNRPYFTAYFKPSTLGIFYNQLDAVSEEWGYLLLLGTLAQALIFGLVIIILPLAGRWKSMFQGTKSTLGVIVYYSCLGLSYMFIEIYLIQKLVFYLAEPIFSVSIVLTTMLIISGLGSLFSSKFISRNPVRNMKFVALAIAVCVVFYLTVLPWFLSVTLGLPFIAKVLFAVLLISPVAFFMGMPFPTGLTYLAKNKQELMPWAWGMNGALSVTGSVLARLISIHYSFAILLLIAAFLYATVGMIFKVNLADSE